MQKKNKNTLALRQQVNHRPALIDQQIKQQKMFFQGHNPDKNNGVENKHTRRWTQNQMINREQRDC